MTRVIPVLLLCACWISAQTPAAAAAAKGLEADGIDEAVAQLSKITGLERLRKVQKDTITRSGIKQFLEEKIKEEVRPEDIRLEELSLKRFGLVPKDFDLKSATVDLITEQAAAFYDFRKKKLFILEGDEPNIPGANGDKEFGKAAQRMIVVHELAHALADQHFDLGKFIRKSRNDDSSTARMAVMEGQATWLMLESMAQDMNQSMRDRPAMIDLMGANAADAISSQYPVLARAPLYMRASLVFPYNQGLKFQHAVLQKMGNEAFAHVFQQPPSSTQQVLHPEKYFAKVEPVKVALPEFAKTRGSRKVLEATVGELEHSILLEQYLSKTDAEEIAPHWRGASLALTENRNDSRVALYYASEWDDAPSARRMFDSLKKILRGKWKSISVESDSETEFRGSGDDGPFLVRLTRTRLTSVEGIETDSRERQVN